MLAFLLLPLFAQAADTTPLFLERQKQLAGTPFFCAIGRQPVADSFDALGVLPTPDCRFNGPLDSVRNPVLLEPPFLNPTFKLDALSALLRLERVSLGGDGRFTINGEGLRAQMVPFKQLKDALFHLGAFLPAWGSTFLSITADRASGVSSFADLAKRHPETRAFWANSLFENEKKVLPWLQRANRVYTPIPLIPKCGDLGPLPKLLLVGDLHRGEDSTYFTAILAKYNFAFAMLEVNLDKQSALDTFLAATDPGTEALALSSITEQYPNDVITPFQGVLRSLKARRVPIILMDSEEAYFNFPYTDLGFHGLPLAARNLHWVSRLPATWEGTGVLLGGRDHFVDLPQADFQDFALERFPGLEMKFVNPSETCR